MIVSVSRRTDIPALYATWLRRRLEEGWCAVPNPYRPRQVARVSLRSEDVDAMVFWTRHARPLFDVLPLLDAGDIPYYVQYTITGYGRPVEMRTPPLETAIATFQDLAGRLPTGAVVWRYDPILVGPAFPAADHMRRFEHIAVALEGRTKRVVLSVVDLYRKTRRRLGEVLRWGDDLAPDPMTGHGVHDLLASLAEVARAHGMTPEACAEEEDLTPFGIAPTKCIDDRLLADLFGGTWPSRKDPGQRPACGCIPSRDIGIPDTCTFGCAYCYATRSDAIARRRRAEHDPTSPSLWGRFEPTGGQTTVS